jgi:undecaprenyl-diphosphatase
MLWTADEGIILYLNRYAAKSELFDKFLTVFLQRSSVRLLPIVICLVWVWFYKREPNNQRIAVVQALLGAAVAFLASRLIQNVSPFRPRPLHSETLGFVLPYGVSADTLREWSSFPSDTTAVAFALATGVWIASRPLGWGCLVWAAVVVGFPRIYAGLHYPTDILGAALMGMFFTLLCSRLSMKITGILSIQEQRSPALFYSCFFAILFQVTTLFEDIRGTIQSLSKLF